MSLHYTHRWFVNPESVTASGGDYSAVVADLVAAVDVAVSACVALGPITVGVQVDVIAKLFVDIFLVRAFPG
jgi:hypothetical protein